MPSDTHRAQQHKPTIGCSRHKVVHAAALAPFFHSSSALVSTNMVLTLYGMTSPSMIVHMHCADTARQGYVACEQQQCLSPDSRILEPCPIRPAGQVYMSGYMRNHPWPHDCSLQLPRSPHLGLSAVLVMLQRLEGHSSAALEVTRFNNLTNRVLLACRDTHRHML